MEDLPTEIILKIFKYLNYRVHISILTSTCWQWYNLIESLYVESEDFSDFIITSNLYSGKKFINNNFLNKTLGGLESYNCKQIISTICQNINPQSDLSKIFKNESHLIMIEDIVVHSNILFRWLVDNDHLNLIKYIIKNQPKMLEIFTDCFGILKRIIMRKKIDMFKYLTGIESGYFLKINSIMLPKIINLAYDHSFEIATYMCTYLFKEICMPLLIKKIIINGHLDRIKNLNQTDFNHDDGHYIVLASYYGHDKIVEYLIEQKINIHSHNDSAIINAVYGGHLNIVKILHKSGVDLNIQNGALISKATKYNHIDIYQYIIQNI